MANFTNVSINGLRSAMFSAQSGDVITQTGGAGAPLLLNLDGLNVADPGIAVVFDPAQVVQIIHYATPAAGISFYGGILSGDTVAGNDTGFNPGVKLLSGSSRIAFRGARFNNSLYAFSSSGAVTDIDLDSCRWDYNRNDCIQLPDPARVRVNNCGGGELIAGAKFCYFNDGRAPIENIDGPTCTAQGGQWQDTDHSDFMQFYGTNSGTALDITITNNAVKFIGQGFNTYSGYSGLNGAVARRVKIWNNTIQVPAYDGIAFYGDQFDVRDNICSVHPDYPTFTDQRITIGPDTGVSTVNAYGGRNSANIVSVASPATACNLASTSYNGAAVTAAELPRMTIPAWFPSMPSRPAAPTITSPPQSAEGGPTVSFFTTPDVGIWLSCNRRKWRDANAATFEFRWKKNGIVVTGNSANYQVQSGDAGSIITAEVRGTTGLGTGSWASTPNITIPGAAAVTSIKGSFVGVHAAIRL